MKQMISRLVHKMKRWIRKKRLFHKYNHNYESQRLIVTSTSDRCLGLTTMMMEDCLLRGCRLYVSDIRTKENFSRDISKYCQLGLFPQCPTLAAYQAFDDYLLCPEDLHQNRFKSRRNIEVIVDNSCTVDNVEELLGAHNVSILNGFVYVPLAKC